MDTLKLNLIYCDISKKNQEDELVFMLEEAKGGEE